MTNLRIFYILLLCHMFFFPLYTEASIGVCVSEDGKAIVSITANDNGQLLDLAVTIDDTKISRFPEANNTSVDLPSHRYKFSVKKRAHHDALDLDITDKKGWMRYQGKNIDLECSWY